MIDPVNAEGVPPTVTAGAGLGTSPPAPLIGPESTNGAGTIQLGTGTTPPAGPNTLCTLVFSAPLSGDLEVQLTPQGAAFPSGSLFIVSVSATQVVIGWDGAALTASQAVGTYNIDYEIIRQGQ